MLKKTLFTSMALVAALAALPAFADPGYGLANEANNMSDLTIAGFGGSSRFHVEGGGSEGSANGNDIGASLQWAGHVSDRNRLLVQASYDKASVSDQGVDMDGHRLDAVIGYMRDFGQQSDWFVGPAIHSLKLSACDTTGACVGSTRTGYGVTGGLVLPFASHFVASTSLGVAHYSGDGADPLDGATFDVGIEYRPSLAFGITAGVNSSYYRDTDDDSVRLSVVNWRVGITGHF